MIHTNGVRQTLARIHSGFNSPWSASGLGDKAKAFLRTTAWQLNPEEDEMLCFEHYQGMIESSRELRTKAWPEVRFKSTNLLTKMNRKIRSAGELAPYKYLLTGLLRPNDGKCLQIVAHHETFRRLTITAIALKRFQLRQGHFPATLGKLVPEFISAVPIDPMNIQPLRYRLNADGTFVLYSVGEDGKDDGGDPTPTNSKSPPDLWNARDAVWPVAEESSNIQAPSTRE
jgi:hypothetical protein